MNNNNNNEKLADASYIEGDKNRKKSFYFSKIDPPPLDVTIFHQCPAVPAVESLIERSFFVMDDFVSPEEVLALRAEVAEYEKEGRMQEGQIGSGDSGSEASIRKDMRDDIICWLEGSESWVGPAMKRHILRMDVFSQKISILLDAIKPELSWKGAGRTKIMASLYRSNYNNNNNNNNNTSQQQQQQVGARYVPHYDNPNKNGRKLTTILYLNPDWRPQDGGCLRLKTTKEICDISPLGGRLICFWSDRRVPHEVLHAKASDRYAITIWYLDADERKEAERRTLEAVQKAKQAMSENEK